MQRLRAVVKTFKADPVCQALLAAGVDEVYVEEVQGYGRQKGHLGLYRQPAYGISFLPKIAITAYVPEALVEAACQAIETAAATGTIGDGKIFLAPVEYAIPQSLENLGVEPAQVPGTHVPRKVRAKKSPPMKSATPKTRSAGKPRSEAKYKAKSKPRTVPSKASGARKRKKS